jgi:multiple sugar transport system ATP-binding protein
LDAKLRVATRTELRRLHNRLKATSIYVTHDQAEAMTLGDRICLMLDGRIQQIAAPMEVYDNPANLFVAGFLGTPPMNFFNGVVQFQGSRAVFKIAENTISLPENMKEKLASYKNKPTVLGIRPESVSPLQYPGQSGNKLLAVVNVIEPLGDKTSIHSNVDGNKFIAGIEPHIKINKGVKTEFYIDMNRVHVFEPGKTGRRII